MKYITKSKEKLKLHGFSTYYISMEKEKYNAFVLTMGRLCVGINLRVVFFIIIIIIIIIKMVVNQGKNVPVWIILFLLKDS